MIMALVLRGGLTEAVKMNKTEEKGKEKSISDFLKVELTVEVQKNNASIPFVMAASIGRSKVKAVLKL